MNLYFKLPSESGKSCRPVNSLLGYWSFTSWRNTYFFMQDFRSSSILPSQKNFINLFPQKKSDRLLMRHYSKTEIAPEVHVISRHALAAFWVPPVFNFLGFYLCQFSYIQPILLWHPYQVHVEVLSHQFLYFVGIISGTQ